MHVSKLVTSGLAAGILGVSAVFAAHAAPATVVVTPANTQGWSTADTRPGGTVSFVNDSTAPLGTGALQLTTDSTNAAKAQYMHAANVPLSSNLELSYQTKQVSGPPTADPSYQLVLDLDGNGTPDTTLVYEPYWNGTVNPGAWQYWDVTSGQFWSSKTVTDGSCSLTAGSGGAPFYTLADVAKMCPNAVVLGFGVNIGSYNPNYVVETDAVDFNGTTYNFELTNTPTSKEQCKNGGYQNLTDDNGNAFPNQGQCVSYFNHQSHS